MDAKARDYKLGGRFTYGRPWLHGMDFEWDDEEGWRLHGANDLTWNMGWGTNSDIWPERMEKWRAS